MLSYMIRQFIAAWFHYNYFKFTEKIIVYNDLASIHMIGGLFLLFGVITLGVCVSNTF